MGARRALLSVAALACSATAQADTLRCRNSLIEEGMAQAYVLEKCGPPDSKMDIKEPVMARRPNGTTFQVGISEMEIWRYNRGSGKFPAVLTFDGGKLRKLEFEK
jgi:hypothetical protein